MSKEEVDEELGNWDNSSFYSRWTFSIANNLLRKGKQRAIQYPDLLQLPKQDQSKNVSEILQHEYLKGKNFYFIPRLLVALINSQIFETIIVSIFAILEGVVRIASPVVLKSLLTALQDNSKTNEAYLWAGVLSILNILQTGIHHVLFFYTMRAGNNWRTSTTALIFSRLFRLRMSDFGSSDPSNKDQNDSFGTGKLVNLISNDVSRFEFFSVFAVFSWVSMFELIAILALLIYYLDIASGIAGVGMTILFIPIQIKIAKLFASARKATGFATDQRVRFISEVIDGISTVKSYNWETPFFNLISDLRNTEVKNIRESNHCRSVNLGLYYFSPTVASFATFVVYWGKGGHLTVPLVFSVMALLLQLRTTVGRQWTRSIELGSETIASCHRIEAFLNVADNGESRVDKLEDRNMNEPSSQALELSSLGTLKNGEESGITGERVVPILQILKSSYCHSKRALDGSEFILRDISLSVNAHELVMVVGAVGAGKSSLLNAILDEMTLVVTSTNECTGSARQLRPNCRIAYCAQRPWILAGTARSNIVLAGDEANQHSSSMPLNEDIASFLRLDKQEIDLDSLDHVDLAIRNQNYDVFKNPIRINDTLYQKAVESCQLSNDFELWPHGDMTEIGERGISISGGQKARIALARAIYSDSDLYVLDDVLSAVDAHVGQSLFFGCILETLRDRNKAVVLATHQLQYLKHADKILVMSKTGQQLFFGSYEEFSSRADEFSDILSAMKLEGSSEGIDDESKEENLDQALPVQAPHQDNTEGKKSKSTALEGASSKRSTKQAGGVQAEDRVEGKLSYAQIKRYILSGGIVNGSVALLLAVLAQCIQMITDYWLRWWAGNRFGDQEQARYAWIFGILTVICIFIGLVKASSWFHFSLEASHSLHSKALWAVLHSPLYFFVANPTGRILNRFSRDQYQVDELLPYTMFDFLQSLLFCLAAIVLVCVSIPWLLLLMPPLLFLFIQARESYIRCSREIKRIEATLRSPIYADFSAALEGLTTLRAYKLEKRASASFQAQIDRSSRAWFNFLLISRWLGFRLDCESAVLLTFTAFFAVILRNQINDVGLIGYTLTYTLSLSGLLQWCCRQSAETENMLTSVERISVYSELPPEPGYASTYAQHEGNGLRGQPKQNDYVAIKIDDASIDDVKISKSDSYNDSRGDIIIKGLTVTYRHDMEPVLNDLDLIIPAGSKVGICGRTGSGKSSTLLALLRLNIIVSGDILVDGKSLLKMSLEDARGLISVIPQDPHLFSGTLRFNLDPFGRYTDSEIWSALSDAHIKDYISKSEFGLDSHVEEHGKNFSAGQRQLLSLARAILRKCRIVLMDEVTASIDYTTDRMIQHTIRESPNLKSATIITVAHRLRTIADSDCITVVDSGRIIETGSPKELLQINSQFENLAKQSNEFDEIVRIAETKYGKIFKFSS